VKDASGYAAIPLEPQAGTTRRVVLLGASNLTKGIGTVLETAYRVWGRPLEVVSALGHGRSYGRVSSVLGRQLPGILECGLWQVLGRSPGAPTAGLVTDIGNDLLYGESVEHIAGWLEQCLDRLAAVGARTVVTLLPVDNLRTLSRARFAMMRTIFFPQSRVSLETISQRAHALNEHARRLAVDRGFGWVVQRTSWYGFDPIHIKPRQRPLAWQEILAWWSASSELSQPVRSTLARTLYLRSRVPERRRVLGFEQRGLQPSGRLNDGTTVAIY
jgi:hypothetical protein